MELLERYLQAVRGYLLRWRRDDIIKELGDNILSQMEDRATELGRPLSEAEQGEILKQHGHPVVAAARYQRLPMQHLIGPTLFPLYWFALQAMAAMIALFHGAMFLVLVAKEHLIPEAMVTTWASFWLWIVGAVGILTIGFGLMEYFGKGRIPLTDQFDPRELPGLKKKSPQGNAIAELILGSLLIVGWLIFLHAPTPVFAALIPFHLAPVWWRFELPMLLSVALGVAAAFVRLYRPGRPQLRASLRLTSDVVGVITLYLFLGAREFIVLSQPGTMNDVVQLGRHALTTAQIANYSVALGPAIALVVFLGDGIVELVGLLRRRTPPMASSQPMSGIL
jgi:hypothetical protein